MSDSISKNWPRLSQGWTKPIDAYDGFEEIERTWRGGLKPDPALTVSEWADQYRVLSPKSAAEPGRWRTDRTPYLKEIMDCLSVSSPVQRIVLGKEQYSSIGTDVTTRKIRFNLTTFNG